MSTDIDLVKKAKEIRRDIISVCVRNGAGHIAPSLSCVDILVALYYSILRRTDDPQWEERDRLVFSKAHGCYGLYAVLADIGYVPRHDWECFYKGSFLSGCSERSVEHGIEASGGSLGHGLPMAAGIAFGAKLQQKGYRVFCIVGDGELQEGSNWEAIQFAVKHSLDNLTVIVDNNGLQAMDFLENVLTPKGRRDDLKRKFEGFGCSVRTTDGHNCKALTVVLAKKKQGMVSVVLARTIKGYGLRCMENVSKFHFRLPTGTELAQGNRYE